MLNYYIHSLSANRAVFADLFRGLTEAEYIWHEREGKWNLLQVVCHLYDEEREDFRARIKSVLEDHTKPFASIDPAGWVVARNYSNNNFKEKVENFLEERNNSLEWLNALVNPNWESAFIHAVRGPISGKFLLANWVAHDYLHLRQIIRIKYNYLHFITNQSLDYAGDW